MKSKLLKGAGMAGLLLAGVAVVFAEGPGGPRPEQGRPGPGGPGEGRHGRRARIAHMKEALGLSDQQMDQLHKLRTDGEKTAIRKRADLRIARMELHELMGATTLDEKAVQAKVREVADLDAAMLRARVDGHLAMRK